MSEENKDDGGSAFPTDAGSAFSHKTESGMSLRDYFAAAALMGLTANTHEEFLVEPYTPGVVAKHAYRLADAMLEARSK